MTRHRLGTAVAVLLVATALVASLLVLILGKDQPPLAVRLLDRSRAFIGEAKSATFDTRSRFETEEAGFGSFFTATAKGVVAFPDRFRMSQESEGFHVEVIGIGDTFYVREAEDADALEEEQWAKYDDAEADRRSGVVRPPSFVDEGLGGGLDPTAGGSPTDLRRVLRGASDPVILRTSGPGLFVVRADLDPDRAFGDQIGEDVDSATIELTTSRQGRITRMLIRYESSGDTGTADYRLSAWDRPVRVEAPPERDVDPTPLVDEAELAAFTAAPLLQPAGIPAGWVFEGAFVVPADETVEGCDQVEVDYLDPDDPDSGYLYLFELPTSCADLEPPGDAAPFVVGRATGWIQADEEEGFTFAQVVVGRTVVQADTDLSPADLAAVLAELVPFDPARVPRPLTGIGASTSAA
jgi:hypothetical protein